MINDGVLLAQLIMQGGGRFSLLLLSGHALFHISSMIYLNFNQLKSLNSLFS